MIQRFLVRLIRYYQRTISPHTGASCRYLPTCSQYAVEAIETHGACKGTLLSVWRILRCNPFHRQKSIEYDPVP